MLKEIGKMLSAPDAENLPRLIGIALLIYVGQLTVRGISYIIKSAYNASRERKENNQRMLYQTNAFYAEIEMASEGIKKNIESLNAKLNNKEALRKLLSSGNNSKPFIVLGDGKRVIRDSHIVDVIFFEFDTIKYVVDFYALLQTVENYYMKLNSEDFESAEPDKKIRILEYGLDLNDHTFATAKKALEELANERTTKAPFRQRMVRRLKRSRLANLLAW